MTKAHELLCNCSKMFSCFRHISIRKYIEKIRDIHPVYTHIAKLNRRDIFLEQLQISSNRCLTFSKPKRIKGHISFLPVYTNCSYTILLLFFQKQTTTEEYKTSISFETNNPTDSLLLMDFFLPNVKCLKLDVGRKAETRRSNAFIWNYRLE